MVATVKDATGRPVGGLNKEDFTLFDNGVKQTIALFETAHVTAAVRHRSDRHERFDR